MIIYHDHHFVSSVCFFSLGSSSVTRLSIYPSILRVFFCLFFINGNDLSLSGVFGQYSIYNDFLFTFAAVWLRNRCAVFDKAYAQCLQYLVYYTPPELFDLILMHDAYVTK